MCLKISGLNIQYFIFYIFIFLKNIFFGIVLDLSAVLFHSFTHLCEGLILLFIKNHYEKSICEGTQKFFLWI